MGSRRRFFDTVAHRRPDQVPLDLWGVRPEVMRALRAYLGTDDVEAALGSDFAHAGIGQRFADFERRAAGPKGGDWPGSGGRYVWHDERTFEDAWGVVHRVGSDGKLVEWISGPLVAADDADEFDWPDFSCLASAAEVGLRVEQLKAADKVVCGGVTMPFKQAWQMRGLENLLCDMMINRPFVEKLYDRIYALQTERAVRCARAGLDYITVTGDIAMNDRLLFAPEVFRDLDVPRMGELIRQARSVRPEVLFFYHSDGDIREVMDDLIAIGFDIINPIQPECMDPYEVKRRWGDRITMWGSISVRTTLPLGTPESVKAEVQERIRGCGYDGGLVIAPSNVIMYDTPVVNVVAMCEAVRDFRWDD